MGLARRDIGLHTYADYIRWQDGVRYELIDGIAYAMSPAPTRRHQEVVGELYRQIANTLKGSACQPYIAPFDVRLPKANANANANANVADGDIDTVVQPDISVICDQSKLDERGCCGAPDWVIEVLSPSTAGHDQIVKRALYERVGVREFWLVHPVDRIVTIYVLENGSYGKPAMQELVNTSSSVILPAVMVDWTFDEGATQFHGAVDRKNRL
ncbi:MAG: Uma2 family endonuclease [Rhodoferax sp.]|nr:Uma2 family endonuclease [Rhodoferax sp.]